jgi:hypothetical protein
MTTVFQFNASEALQIAAAAANPEALPAGWTLVACGDSFSLQAILAQQASSGAYAIAIRGTQPKDILNWLIDFDIFRQVPFVGAPGALISSGADLGRQILLRMRLRPAVQAARDQRLEDFLKAQAKSGTPLLVTGHSLGANLASVLAPWIVLNLGYPDDSVYPALFAPPTAGNKAFADHFNGMKHSYVLINDNDVVPRAWNRILEIKKLYSPAPTMPLDLKLAVDLFEATLIGAGVHYEQTRAYWFTAALESPPAASWGAEVGFQHSIATYQTYFSSARSQR